MHHNTRGKEKIHQALNVSVAPHATKIKPTSSLGTGRAQTFLSSLPSQLSGPPCKLVLSLDTLAYLDTVLVLQESLAATSQPNAGKPRPLCDLPQHQTSLYQVFRSGLVSIPWGPASSHCPLRGQELLLGSFGKKVWEGPVCIRESHLQKALMRHCAEPPRELQGLPETVHVDTLG